jgi:catechol 2,3-dioxygenase-like lactoylglutathione lyase family enzyme
MSPQPVHGLRKIMAFVATEDAARAKAFYRDTLALPLISEDGFALVFDVQGIMLRVQLVEKVSVAPYTVLGWQVEDIISMALALERAGVKFARYPGLEQDEHGVWTAPGGAKVAWFHDPDGNTLSITEF